MSTWNDNDKDARRGQARVRGVEGASTSTSMSFKQGHRLEWIGWSQISHVSRDTRAGTVTITIPVWLAEKCGFEYEEA